MWNGMPMKNKQAFPILLDTHVWIWFAEASHKFSKSTIQLIDNAIKNRSVFVSDISLWEISMLANKGKIILSLPTRNWLETSIKTLALELIPISPQIAVESTLLPGEFHKDPADRLIVATARCENLTLLTADSEILSYAAKDYLHTIPIE